MGLNIPNKSSKVSEIKATTVASSLIELDSIHKINVTAKIRAITFSGAVIFPISCKCSLAHSLAFGVSFTCGGKSLQTKYGTINKQITAGTTLAASQPIQFKLIPALLAKETAIKLGAQAVINIEEVIILV